MARQLPSLAGHIEAHPDYKRNRFLRWHGLGKPAHGYIVEQKNKREMPGNWPFVLTSSINAHLAARGIDPLVPVIDTEAHRPQSLVLMGHHQWLFPDETQREQLRRTRGALMVAINYFDRTLTELSVEKYTRGKTLYLKTDLSSSYGRNSLDVTALTGIPGIVPGHFTVYTHSCHRLGVKVNCTHSAGFWCQCGLLALDVLPAMWHVG